MSGGEGDQQWVVCDGMRGKAYKAVYGAGRFTEDGHHLWAVVQEEGKGPMVAVDGIEGHEHQQVLMFRDSMAEPGKLRYVVVDAGEAWLVETAWPEGTDWTNGMSKMESAGPMVVEIWERE